MVDIQDKAPTVAVLRFLHGARGWQTVLASGVAVLTAATASMVLLSSDPASADTIITVERQAQVYLADGTNHAATEGERLPRGAELHTGNDGGAQLTTAGRVVYVGAGARLVITDGVRQDLTQGSAMIDSRHGARLVMTTPAGDVATPSGALARVEDSQTVRLAVYDGSATITAAGRGSSLRVPALFQTQVQPSALPDRITPLHLRANDAWEKSLAANLVNDDTDLTTLASGLVGQDGSAVLGAAPASLRTTATPAAGADRGEQALAVAVAQAAKPGTQSTEQTLSEVQQYRSENGSWGVVAALVNAPVSSISALLDAALNPTDTPQPGGTTTTAGTFPTPFPFPTTAPTAVPTTPGGRPTSRPTRSTGPTSTPTTPTSTPSPGLVHGLVDTVVGLLLPPSPSAAAPTGKSAPVVPKPSPSPLLGIHLPLGH